MKCIYRVEEVRRGHTQYKGLAYGEEPRLLISNNETLNIIQDNGIYRADQIENFSDDLTTLLDRALKVNPFLKTVSLDGEIYEIDILKNHYGTIFLHIIMYTGKYKNEDTEAHFFVEEIRNGKPEEVRRFDHDRSFINYVKNKIEEANKKNLQLAMIGNNSREVEAFDIALSKILTESKQPRVYDSFSKRELQRAVGKFVAKKQKKEKEKKES